MNLAGRSEKPQTCVTYEEPPLVGAMGVPLLLLRKYLFGGVERGLNDRIVVRG